MDTMFEKKIAHESRERKKVKKKKKKKRTDTVAKSVIMKDRSFYNCE